MTRAEAQISLAKLKQYMSGGGVVDRKANEAIDMAIDALRQPERKTGRWLPDNNNYYEERFICSVCGRSYKVDTCMGKPMWDFCPCGADMRGENDETCGR